MRSPWLIGLLLIAFLLQGTGPVFMVLSFLLQQDRITRELCVNVNRPELECKGKCYLVNQFESETRTSERAITMHPLQVQQLDLPPGPIHLPFHLPPDCILPRILDPGHHDCPWRQEIEVPPWQATSSLS